MANFKNCIPMDAIRKTTVETMRAGLDKLSSDECFGEERENLIIGLKNYMDDYVNVETINEKLASGTGVRVGIGLAVSAGILGFAVYKGIKYLASDKT